MIGGGFAGSAPIAVLGTVTAPRRLSDDPRRQPFWIAELTGRALGTVADLAWDFEIGAAPIGRLSAGDDVLEDSTSFYVSDLGYLVPAGDGIGQTWYRPHLQTALSVDRAIPLDPAESAVGAAWGEMEIVNPRTNDVGFYDSTVQGYSVDALPLRVAYGTKDWDADRGLHVDPSIDTLTEIFRGIAGPWRVDGDVVRVPLLDQTWRLELPAQTQTYAGTGALEGPAGLAGRRLPRTRGAVLNMTPVLVDPDGADGPIYQYSDGPGSVQAVYERGDETFAFGSDTTDLYGVTGTPGEYYTDNSKGLFMVVPAGGSLAGEITADVTGQFPAAGAVTTIGAMARYLLTEDIGIDAGFVDVTAFAGLDTAYGYTVGLHLAGDETGLEALGLLLRSAGGVLSADATGRLRPVAIAPPSGTPAATLDQSVLTAVRAVALPDRLSIPAWRIRVGYGRNHTIQTSDLDPDVTAERRQFLAQEFRAGIWADTDVAADYRRARDWAVLPTCLADASDAEAVAAALGALWGTRRRIYELDAAISPATREIGETVTVDWPTEGLSGGVPVRILGVRYRSGDSLVTLTVLK